MRHLPTKSDEQRTAKSSERRAELKRRLDERRYQEEIEALERGEIGGFALIKTDSKYASEAQKRQAAKQARENRKNHKTDIIV